MAYVFLTSDDLEDIIDDNYIQFITLCCKYSEYFALAYGDSVEKVALLEPFCHRSKKATEWPGMKSTTPIDYVIYKVTEYSKQILISYVPSLFSWDYHFGGHEPEDLAFYRKDKSVFAYSISHEGFCVINNHKDEDIHTLTDTPNFGWDRARGKYDQLLNHEWF